MLNKRCFVLEPSGNLWGSERVLLDFLHGAADSDWQIGVCCPPDTPILKPLAQLGNPVFPVFRANLHLQGRRQRLLALFALWRSVRRFAPQLIYVNQAGATRLALAAARPLRVPVVTHVRLAEDVDYVLKLNAAPHALPKIICISQFIRNLFPPSHTEQLTMLYDPYVRRAQKESAIPDAPVFSCVGRLARIKGQDVLLRALAHLRCDGVMAKAVFCGAAGPGDNFGDELQRLAAAENVMDLVTWAGFAPSVFEPMARSVALVCPSHTEPLGRVIFEAWDAGTIPIAWAGCGGAAEVIKDSGGGLLYQTQSGESLAQAMHLALRLTPTQRQDMVQRGRDWLSIHCDLTNYTNALLNIWDEAVR